MIELDHSKLEAHIDGEWYYIRDDDYAKHLIVTALLLGCKRSECVVPGDRDTYQTDIGELADFILYKSLDPARKTEKYDIWQVHAKRWRIITEAQYE